MSTRPGRRRGRREASLLLPLSLPALPHPRLARRRTQRRTTSASAGRPSYRSSGLAGFTHPCSLLTDSLRWLAGSCYCCHSRLTLPPPLPPARRLRLTTARLDGLPVRPAESPQLPGRLPYVPQSRTLALSAHRPPHCALRDCARREVEQNALSLY